MLFGNLDVSAEIGAPDGSTVDCQIDVNHANGISFQTVYVTGAFAWDAVSGLWALRGDNSPLLKAIHDAVIHVFPTTA